MINIMLYHEGIYYIIDTDLPNNTTNNVISSRVCFKWYNSVEKLNLY